MMHMAKSRSAGIEIDVRTDARLKELMKQDHQRILMSLPQDALRSQLLKASPELDKVNLEKVLRGIEQLKEHDPLAVLQEDSLVAGEKGGQLNLMKLAPNFEMAIYLAQATGSCIVTDSHFRWKEVRRAIYRRVGWSNPGLSALAHSIEGSIFAFPQNVADIEALVSGKTFATYPALMRDVFKYLSKPGDRGPKPNLEGHLAARFARAHSPAQAAIKKAYTRQGSSNFLRFPTRRHPG
jgi:hypothetical protein